MPVVQVFGVQQLQLPGPLTLLSGSPNGALRSQRWGLGRLGSNGRGLRMQWLKCRGPAVQAQGSGTECQGKGIQKSRFWGEGIWDPLLGALGSRHRIVRIQFVDIQNPVVELGDPGLEIGGSGTCQQGGSGVQCCVRTGAEEAGYLDPGNGLPWLGRQGPLAGLWGGPVVKTLGSRTQCVGVRGTWDPEGDPVDELELAGLSPRAGVRVCRDRGGGSVSLTWT